MTIGCLLRWGEAFSLSLVLSPFSPSTFSPVPTFIANTQQLFFGFWAFEHLISRNKLSKVNCCLVFFLMLLARVNAKGDSEGHLVPIFRRMIGSDGTTVDQENETKLNKKLAP